MNEKARRITQYLDHMLEAIRRINVYTKDHDRTAFDNDTRTQDAVVRNLEIIGEAARQMQQHAPAFVVLHPEVPWALAYKMRNALSHGYAAIDLGIVWNTIQTDLPALELQLAALLDQSGA
jgi:uncharacterized protein with HEPN domain